MRIVIAGGGIAGLVAAHTFIRAGIKPTVIEAGTLGGQWAALPALKYLRVDACSGGLLELIHELGLEGEALPVKGGVMIPVMGREAPVILPHPICMGWEGFGQELLETHWAKTRGDGAPDSRAMNTGNGGADGRMKIHVTGGSFLERLIESVRAGAAVRESAEIAGVNEHSVLIKNSIQLPYEMLITTLPALVFRRLCPAAQEAGMIPVGLRTETLTVVTYHAPDFAQRYAGWDYFYTPWTPYDAVHRLSPGAGVEWSVESNRAGADGILAMMDARAILGEGVAQVKQITTAGHLHPAGALNYPDGVYPLGRYAQWDGRCTVDRVYRRALELVEVARG